jgi:hypothetical protein
VILSPILFNLGADVFLKMLLKAADSNLIKGLLSHVMPSGVVSLQYADGTIFFFEETDEYGKKTEVDLELF